MPRRLIVCSDGTWKTAEVKCPTNVVKMARAIVPVDPRNVPQIVFYDPGVGTGTVLDRFTGGAFGRGLSNNVKDAYRFLVHNHSPGDQLFFFGFSRGAYTVRSCVGLMRKCGLLQKVHADHLEAAYDLYRKRDDTPDTPEAIQFRQKFSREIDVDFLGVWDTVGQLGIPLAGLRWLNRHDDQFHNVGLSRRVKRAFHAIAIDEKRRPFRPALWETPPESTQHVEQVWFAGVHSNVGGGYDDAGLSDVAFLWMKQHAENAGLVLDEGYIRDTIRPKKCGTLYNSFTLAFWPLLTYDREIGVKNPPTESVHPDAASRRDGCPQPYSAPNLTAYLAKPDYQLAKITDGPGTVII